MFEEEIMRKAEAIMTYKLFIHMYTDHDAAMAIKEFNDLTQDKCLAFVKKEPGNDNIRKT